MITVSSSERQYPGALWYLFVTQLLVSPQSEALEERLQCSCSRCNIHYHITGMQEIFSYTQGRCQRGATDANAPVRLSGGPLRTSYPPMGETLEIPLGSQSSWGTFVAGGLQTFLGGPPRRGLPLEGVSKLQ